MRPSTRPGARPAAVLTALAALLLPTLTYSAEGRVHVSARVIEIEAPRLAATAARSWVDETSPSGATSLWARWIHPVELRATTTARPGESPSVPVNSPTADRGPADGWLEVDRLDTETWPPGREMVFGQALAWMEWIKPGADEPVVLEIEWIGN